jgi:hypothetical protein
LAVVALVAAENPVELRSDALCPSDEELAARLRLLVPSQPVRERHIAFLDRIETEAQNLFTFHLRLVRLDGSVVGDRQLVLQGECEDMADAVASVIATWEFTSSAYANAEAPDLKQKSAPISRHGVEVLLGVSAGLALVAGLAPTAGLEAMLGKSASRWRVRLAVSGETARDQKLEGGQVSWQHTSASLGVMLRTLGDQWHFSLDAGPTVGLVSLAGHGYAEDRHARHFEYGAGAGVRIERDGGRFALWLECRSELWAERQEAVLAGASSGSSLSALDVMVRLGASASLFP